MQSGEWLVILRRSASGVCIGDQAPQREDDENQGASEYVLNHRALFHCFY